MQKQQKAEALIGDQTVQTNVQAGQWMFLPEAATATHSSEKTIRRYIKKGIIKSRRLGKQINSPLQVLITPDLLTNNPESTVAVEGMTDIFEVEAEDFPEVDEESPTNNQDLTEQSNLTPNNWPNNKVEDQLAQMLKVIADQFADKLDRQQEYIFGLRKELEEKEIQLRLIPDLQKQLENSEKDSDFQTKALEKQIEALKIENQKLQQATQPFWKKWFRA